MVTQPCALSTFFNILRNRASEETFGKLFMSVYGSVFHDRDLLGRHPEVWVHMVAYTLATYEYQYC